MREFIQNNFVDIIIAISLIYTILIAVNLIKSKTELNEKNS